MMIRYLLPLFLFSQLFSQQPSYYEDDYYDYGDYDYYDEDDEYLDEEWYQYCDPYDADCDSSWYWDDEPSYPTKREDFADELSRPW